MAVVIPVTRTRSLTAAAAAVALGAAVLLIGPSAGPAHACSCMGVTDEQAFAGSQLVFRGQLVGYQPPPPQPVMLSTDPAIWTFAVTEVYKGQAAPSQPIFSAFSGASCGLELPPQGEFFVFAGRRDLPGEAGDGQPWSSLCGGTRSTAAGPLAVTALQAPPTTAVPDTTTIAPATTAVPEVTTSVAPTTTAAATTTTVGAAIEPQSVAGASGVAIATRTARSDEGSGAGLVWLAVAAVIGALVAVGTFRVVRRHQ